MKHARRDYDAIQPWPQKRPHFAKVDGETVDATQNQYLGERLEPIIPEDEPVFLIRGSDPIGWRIAVAWTKLAEEVGTDEAVLEAVRAHALRMAEWYRQHPKPTGHPDTPTELLHYIDGTTP